MLKNYVDDDELKNHYPGLAKQLWTGQTSYARQIAEAFDHAQNDLYNKGIVPRFCMIPLDLRYLTSDQAGGQPKVATEIINTVGLHLAGNNERRMVLDIVSNSGANVIKLQGSNDPSNAPAASTWTDIPGASIAVSGSGSSTQTVMFHDQFRWYRYASTIAVSGSCTFAVSLVEVIFDHLIVMGTFKLIFRDFSTDPGDIWESRYAAAVKEYDENLNLIKFGYDLNDDGKLDPAETERTGQIIFLR